MDNLLVFSPVAQMLGHEPSDEDIVRAFGCGAFQTISIISTGQLPERCSPLQWLWSAHRGDIHILTEQVFRRFLPDFVQVIKNLRELGQDMINCPIWLQSFWSIFVEIPVCN